MGKILNLELCISLVWKMNIEIYIGSQYINKNSKISHCVMAGSMAAAEPTEQGGWGHSRSQQRTGQRVLVLTLKCLALKKTGFSPVKKYFPIFLKLFFTFILCNFSVRTLKYFQKNFKFIFCP